MSELRRAALLIWRSPAYAAAAVLTIALGIGANTAVFTVIRSVLLEPLPFRDPGALVQVWETHPELHKLQVSYPDYLDWKSSLKSADLGAYTFEAIDKGTLLGQGEPLKVQVTNASFQLFSILGITPTPGRSYNAQEEESKAQVVLISERLWRQKFSADKGIIGQSLRLDANSFTILGVVPQSQAFPSWADVWIPLSLTEQDLKATRKYHPLEVIGRLGPGASLKQSQIELDTISRGLSVVYPATNSKIGALVLPLKEAITGEVRPALVAVWIAAGLVLVIACVNVGLLMATRSFNRRRDIAVRLALGATRQASVREFFIETALLSIIGAICGLMLAWAVLPVLVKMSQGRIPRLEAVALDGHALLFGLCASCLIAFLFGLPACRQVACAGLSETLVATDVRVSSARRSWLTTLLMTSQVALSLAVLIAASILVRSFALTLKTDPGFQLTGLLAITSVPIAKDPDKSYQAFNDRMLPALESIPGIQQVAAVNSLPMTLGSTEHTRYATRFGILGKVFAPGQYPVAQIRWCTPNYFQVLGIGLKSGRFLTDADHNGPHYLVNNVFAQRYFPDRSAVGQKLLLNVVSASPDTAEIVGVVDNIQEFGLDKEPEPTLYLLDVSPRMDILIKTPAPARRLAPTIESVLHHIAPQDAIGEVRSLNGYIDNSLARQRFILTLIATFAGLAMTLCAVGIFGVFSHSVSRRRREFGIRFALGAQKEDLIKLILRECTVVLIPGLVAGTAIGLGSSKFLRVLLYKISPTDALSYLVALSVIVLLCLCSALLPTRGVAKVDLVGILKEP
jgi:predicted permease